MRLNVTSANYDVSNSLLNSTGNLSKYTGSSSKTKCSTIKEHSRKVVVKVDCTDTIKSLDAGTKKRLVQAVIDLTENPNPESFKTKREDSKNPDQIESMRDILGLRC